MKQEKTEQKKEKDYRRLSGIKSAVFLVLAVLVLAGMFFGKQADDTGTATVAAAIGLPESTVSAKDLNPAQGKPSVSAEGAVTEAVMEAAAEAETEAVTDAVSETATEKETDAVTDAVTEAAADAANGSREAAGPEEQETLTVSEHEKYTDKEHVALYLHLYDRLPENYITKTRAKKKGWIQEKGNLWEVCPGMSIGGGAFRNEEGILPEKEGRSWKECDIDYQGGNRNGKRLVWSDDGLIYYTGDHYETFECMYGEEK